MATPSHGKYSVSIGSILVHTKWKGTQLSRDLKGTPVMCKIIKYRNLMANVITRRFANVTAVGILSGIDTENPKFNNVCWRDIGIYDFCLYGDRYIIYVPETDLVTDVTHRKFTDFNKCETIVIGIRNTITAEQYAQLQDMIVINGNKKMVPVGDVCEIPDILQQLSYFENTPKKTSRSESPQMHLSILLNIPGLGKLKAEKLINSFGTIHKIASSSVSELSSTLGLNLAREVYKYFNS